MEAHIAAAFEDLMIHAYDLDNYVHQTLGNVDDHHQVLVIHTAGGGHGIQMTQSFVASLYAMHNANN